MALEVLAETARGDKLRRLELKSLTGAMMAQPETCAVAQAADASQKLFNCSPSSDTHVVLKRHRLQVNLRKLSKVEYLDDVVSDSNRGLRDFNWDWRWDFSNCGAKALAAGHPGAKTPRITADAGA
jgi:hypothetical protein